MPLISVIVPVYKVEAYLERCVDSILRQTFTDFELILVDDGSPDGCPAMCDEYAKQDSRVVVIHQENGGPSAARNAGIDRAFVSSDSEWITFIDSDDWVHEQYLELLYHAVIEHGVDISVCGFERTDGEEPVVEIDSCVVAPWNPEDFYVERNINAIVAWGKLYRKALFQNIRYPVGRIHEDEFITYKVLFQGQSIAVVDAPLYAYYQNENGITQSSWHQKRLHSLEAVSEQVIYMKQNKLKKGYQRAVKKYVFILLDHLTQVTHTCDVSVRRKYALKLKTKLKVYLLVHKREFSFLEHRWVYEEAFPCAMWLYWVVNSRKRKG